MFHHPAWAVDSCSSGPPAIGTLQIQVNPTKVLDHQSHPVSQYPNISALPLTFAEGVACESHELLGVGVDGHERETLGYVLAAVIVEPVHSDWSAD